MADFTQVGNLDSVAYATVAQTRPTTPAAGADFDWDNTADWTEVPAYLDEDDIDVSIIDEVLDIDPPAAQMRLSELIFKCGADGFVIPIYETGMIALALDSRATQSGNKTTFGTSNTYRAIVLAFKGTAMLYFPRCRLSVESWKGGKKSLGKMALRVKVFGTSAVPAGYEHYKYNAT